MRFVFINRIQVAASLTMREYLDLAHGAKANLYSGLNHGTFLHFAHEEVSLFYKKKTRLG